MRLLLINHIENALDSLRSTRTRTLLTMLGVSIGVASITLILSLSSGAMRVISDQVQEVGGNIAVIRPGTTLDSPGLNSITAPSTMDFAASSLTEDDMRSIRSIPNIEALSPIMTLGGSVKSDSATARKHTPIISSTSDLITTARLEVRDGQFIDSGTSADSVVLGPQLSIDLFGTDRSIGREVKIKGQTFTIIGVLKRTNKPINYSNIDFDRAAIMTLDAGKDLNHNIAQIQQINIKATSPEKMDGVIAGIKRVLDKNHRGEQDYTILSGDDISRPAGHLFYNLAGTLAAVAAVSLIVGGIGIMNIMLVNVAERTREIGIRKSLGASHRHITWQFLIESLVISLGGGVIGYILGYFVGFIVSRSFLTFDPAFNWEIAAITIILSTLIGTIFGLYPALRASRKDPIEALRQYH